MFSWPVGFLLAAARGTCLGARRATLRTGLHIIQKPADTLGHGLWRRLARTRDKGLEPLDAFRDVRRVVHGQHVTGLGKTPGDIDLMINTPLGSRSVSDEHRLRQAAIAHQVPVLTTISAASAAAEAISALRAGEISVKSLQEYEHGRP